LDAFLLSVATDVVGLRKVTNSGGYHEGS
jgi:hypothetical protein